MNNQVMSAGACLVCASASLAACYFYANQKVRGLKDRFDTIETAVAGSASIADAMATIRRKDPDVAVHMLPDPASPAFWKANRGWAVVFRGTSTSAPVTGWTVGYDDNYETGR